MDRLTLRIENRSDAAGDMPEDISVLGKGITIGRKASNDWSLPDNTRFISGKHIDITFEDGSYILEDVSTNGTFVNGNSKRVDGKHTLSNGDTIRVGSYIVAVVIAQAEESERPTFSGAQRVQAPPTGGTVRTPHTGIQRHTSAATSAGRAQTPDFSQFKTGITGATGVQRPGGGAVSQPPVLTPAPAAGMIPDDFDDDLLGLSPSEPEPTPEPERAATPAPVAEPEPEPEVAPTPPPDATPASSIIPVAEAAPEPAADAAPVFKRAAPVEPASKPVSQASPSPQSGPFSDSENDSPAAPAPDLKPAPARDGDGPFSLSDPTAAPIVPLDPVPVSAQVVEKTDLTPQGLGERFAETTPPRAKPVADPAPMPEPTPAPAVEPVARTAAEAPATPATPAINELLEGFLEGAEVENPDTLAVPLRELGVMLGKCARLGTQEMMQMLQDRSAVKLFVAQEDRTMRIASGNNPMKFMMDPDDAFKALFVEPRDGYQTGPDGFDNALTDIRQHQQAMMAAIQPALADMLEGLAPTEISNDVGGGGGVLGTGARKSWEEYTKRWESRAAQGENGMLDAFIDAFSRRYNQALDSL